MKRQSNINRQKRVEDRLKDLTFAHAKHIGEVLQQEMQKPLTTKEEDKMDAQIEKGIQLSLEVHRLRNLIQKIDKDELKDVPIPENSPYKYAYYLWLLANCTHNPNLIKFTKELKESILNDENEQNR